MVSKANDNVDLDNLHPDIMPKLRQIEWDMWGDEPGFLLITSGYRSPEYNASVGGAKNSQHIKGTAVDLATYNYDYDTIVELLMRLSLAGFNGLGVYKNGSIHADLRQDKAVWGPSFTRDSIPEEYEEVLEAHIEGRIVI